MQSKLIENSNVVKYVNDMLNLVDQLAALGEILKEKLEIAMLWSNLPG